MNRNPISKFLDTASLPVKAFMAISVISAAVILNRTVIAPFMKRQRYKAAEEWANKVFEEEERAKEAGVPSNTNISF